MTPCRVLVTGAGSGVGQGIVKALRISGLPVTVVAADIAPLNAALYRADEAVFLPKVEESGALDRIVTTLNTQRIDVVMIGSEFDLAFFAQNKAVIEAATKALIVTAPYETVAIANDKWLTAEFLRKNGLPHAQSHVPQNIADAATVADAWGYPLILKTRTGTSSRHVHVVQNRDQLLQIFPEVPNPMLQRMVDVPTRELHNEYTCSVFKTPDGSLIGPFTARRTLRGGTSWHVDVAPVPMLDKLLLDIGRALPFIASLNVQLMVGADGPIPFELNARFSGTTAIRAHFGFNEPAMTLRAFHYSETISPPNIRRGMALRYVEEVFLDNETPESLCAHSPKGTVHAWF